MDSEPSIVQTTHTELSLLYRVLRLSIRPVRPKLVKPKGTEPAGSPELKVQGSLKCAVKAHETSGINLYTFTGPGTPSDPAHKIYYFAGGGFQSPPAKEHWKTCDQLAIRLASSGYSVTIVSYPLAPNTPAPDAFPMLQKWLSETSIDAASRAQSITLVGDSAGGNVVLNLGLWWAARVPSAVDTAHPLKQVVVISPATDLRNRNPDIKKAAKLDPILTVDMTGDVGKKWAGSWGVDHPEVSPNLSPNISLLGKVGIKVHGVVGTADVLAPDALVFKDLCKKNGVRGEWLIWEGQMHCFPLAAVYGLSEGKTGRDWIVDVLRRNV